MTLGSKLLVSKPGVSVDSARPKDFAFSSDYNLPKIARCLKGNSTTPPAHGLPYTPQIKSFVEFESGKFSTIGAGATADNTHIYAGDNEYIYVFIDQLSSGSYKKDMKDKAAVLVGIGDEGDHKYKLHSGYDTLKVFKTGTMTLTTDIYDPGVGGGVKVDTVTFNHNLGYVPVFGPFLSNIFSIEFYNSSNLNFYDMGEWADSTLYYTGDYITTGIDTYYRCIKTHTSSSSTQPGVGANWETYWEIFDVSSYWGTDVYDIYVNKMDDFKGAELFGWEGQNYSELNYYATSTQLVLEITRYCSAEDLPLVVYEPFPAITAKVDYTIFVNRIDEEFSLL